MYVTISKTFRSNTTVLLNKNVGVKIVPQFIIIKFTKSSCHFVIMKNKNNTTASNET